MRSLQRREALLQRAQRRGVALGAGFERRYPVCLGFGETGLRGQQGIKARYRQRRNDGAADRARDERTEPAGPREGRGSIRDDGGGSGALSASASKTGSGALAAAASASDTESSMRDASPSTMTGSCARSRRTGESVGSGCDYLCPRRPSNRALIDKATIREGLAKGNTPGDGAECGKKRRLDWRLGDPNGNPHRLKRFRHIAGESECTSPAKSPPAPARPASAAAVRPSAGNSAALPGNTRAPRNPPR